MRTYIKIYGEIACYRAEQYWESPNTADKWGFAKHKFVALVNAHNIEDAVTQWIGKHDFYYPEDFLLGIKVYSYYTKSKPDKSKPVKRITGLEIAYPMSEAEERLQEIIGKKTLSKSVQKTLKRIVPKQRPQKRMKAKKSFTTKKAMRK